MSPRSNCGIKDVPICGDSSCIGVDGGGAGGSLAGSVSGSTMVGGSAAGSAASDMAESCKMVAQLRSTCWEGYQRYEWEGLRFVEDAGYLGRRAMMSVEVRLKKMKAVVKIRFVVPYLDCIMIRWPRKSNRV
jgi:hypothetical protein